MNMNIIVMLLGALGSMFLGYLLCAHDSRCSAAFSLSCGVSITVLIGWFIISHPFKWMMFDLETDTLRVIIFKVFSLCVLLCIYCCLAMFCFKRGAELNYSPATREKAYRTGKSMAQIAEEKQQAKRRQIAQEQYDAQLAEVEQLLKLKNAGIRYYDLDDSDALDEKELVVPKMDPAEVQALMDQAIARAIQARAEAAATASETAEEIIHLETKPEDVIPAEQARTLEFKKPVAEEPSAEEIEAVYQALLAGVSEEYRAAAKKAIAKVDLAFLARKDVLTQAEVFCPKKGEKGNVHVRVHSAVYIGTKKPAMA